jgi:hypothetical protein
VNRTARRTTRRNVARRRYYAHTVIPYRSYPYVHYIMTVYGDGVVATHRRSHISYDPVTTHVWITCFCGTHRALPVTLGEYHVAHPEVHA